MQAMITIGTVLVLWCLAASQGITVDPSEVAVAKANTQFGHRLYQEVRRKPGNVLFSPLSVGAVLAMAIVGAAGETADQLAVGFGLVERSQVEHGFQLLLARLQVKLSGGNVTLHIANKMYTDISVEVKPDYILHVQQSFQSEVQEMDFASKPEKARNSINQWVASRTGNLIQDFLSQGSVGKSTVMIVVNAMYFKGKWVHPFPANKTKIIKFHLDTNRSKDVQMMYSNSKDLFHYAEYQDYKILRLDYEGGDVSMLVLLPKLVDGLARLEERLPALDWSDIDSQLSRPIRVQVTLPRFTLESHMDLQAVLSKLGLTSLFSGTADFSHITNRPVHISKLVQRTRLEVSEEGARAATVTGGNMRLRSAKRKLDVQEFVADHPFLFLLRDEASGALLFYGRYSDPK